MVNTDSADSRQPKKNQEYTNIYIYIQMYLHCTVTGGSDYTGSITCKDGIVYIRCMTPELFQQFPRFQTMDSA